MSGSGLTCLALAAHNTAGVSRYFGKVLSFVPTDVADRGFHIPFFNVLGPNDPYSEEPRYPGENHIALGIHDRKTSSSRHNLTVIDRSINPYRGRFVSVGKIDNLDFVQKCGCPLESTKVDHEIMQNYNPDHRPLVRFGDAQDNTKGGQTAVLKDRPDERSSQIGLVRPPKFGGRLLTYLVHHRET